MKIYVAIAYTDGNPYLEITKDIHKLVRFLKEYGHLQTLVVELDLTNPDNYLYKILE